jgi:FkbM family methyltransferase
MTWVWGHMRRKLRAAYLYLRSNGFRRFCAATYDQLHTAMQIYFRGSNRTVTIDGCQFPLRNLANNFMKLALLDGSYETLERAAVRKYLQPNSNVVEFGACVGVVSCITNRMLINPKAHVVVEMNPLAIPHLESNRQKNQCFFRIVNSALAYDTPEIRLRAHVEFWGNFLNQGGNKPEVTVPTTQLQRILEEEKFEEYTLICDIEGQEYELLTHELDAVRKAELIIMEVHPAMTGEQKVQEILSKLKESGFQLIEKSVEVVVLKKEPKVSFANAS